MQKALAYLTLLAFALPAIILGLWWAALMSRFLNRVPVGDHWETALSRRTMQAMILLIIVAGWAVIGWGWLQIANQQLDTFGLRQLADWALATVKDSLTALGGVLQIAAVAIIWGSVSLIVRLTSAPLPVVVFYRVGVATLALTAGLLVFRRTRELRRAVRSPVLIGLGIGLAINWLLYFGAIRSTSVASAVLTSTSAPVFIAMLSWPLLREAVRPVALAATGLALGGVALMTGFGADSGDVSLLGVGLGLASALTYALIIVYAKIAGVAFRPETVTTVQTGAATLVLLPFAIPAGLVVSPFDLALLITLGLVHTAFCLSIYYRGLRHVPAQTAGVLGLLEPVSAVVLAALVLREPLSPATLLGGAMILCGVLLVRVQR